MDTLPSKRNTELGKGNVHTRFLCLCTRAGLIAFMARGGCTLSSLVVLALLTFGCAGPTTRVFPPGDGALVVALEGLRNDRGTVVVSLFSGQNGFPDRVSASMATVTSEIYEGKATVSFSSLPYGEYAISVLHDEDGDGLMATGLFGAPREGFGFSGYPEYRFGQPAYETVRFFLLEPQREMTIPVRYETGRRQHQDEGRAAESRRPQE